jgi:hypothetical protein
VSLSFMLPVMGTLKATVPEAGVELPQIQENH